MKRSKERGRDNKIETDLNTKSEVWKIANELKMVKLMKVTTLIYLQNGGRLFLRCEKPTEKHVAS